MASFCRSALMASSRSIVARSKTVTAKSLNPTSMSSPFSSTTRAIPRASRILSVLGGAESLLPLHSAIASARLKSSIAVDSTCWSCLSQGFSAKMFLNNEVFRVCSVFCKDLHHHCDKARQLCETISA